MLRQLGLAVAAATLAASPASTQQLISEARRDSLSAAVGRLERELGGLRVPLDTVWAGAQVVESGATHRGNVVVAGGDLEVRGIVEGDAVALDGNVILHPGSAVRGNAIAVGGEVRGGAGGATVSGEIRSVRADRPGLAALMVRPAVPRRSVGHAASLAASWFLILAAIGFAVVLLRLGNLEAVSATISDGFSRAFFTGVLGQLALLPALVLVTVALAITLIGIPLIPVVFVAALLAVNGAAALGILGMAHANGASLLSRRGAPAGEGGRLTALRYVLVGLSIYFALWLLAALFSWAGFVGSLLKLVAVAVTWVAVTVGFGAV
ncbi:MAG: hypothetical protein ACREON_07405, partial [Gemmatimonadaceae bacterium]